MKIFITGGAGYIGGMLADQFSKRADIEEIILLDKDPMPDLLKGNNKIFWINANTSDGTWQTKVAEKKPEVVIHCAWQIREMCWHRKMQWKWNVDGSFAVFDFAFNTPSVKRLVYFSTASSYGAFPSNTLEHKFTEDEPFREDEYLYGIEKRTVEEALRKKYLDTQSNNKKVPQIFIVRPAAITGPRGRFMFKRFGLVATLNKRLPNSFIYKILSAFVTIIPVTPFWCRQYIHEDDVNDIIALLALGDKADPYEVFNITPPSDPVLGKEMANIIKRKTFPVTPWMVRIGFFLARTLSLGKISTTKGGWKFYSYPIVMDGTKITKKYGYQYKYMSRDALAKTTGRYEGYVAEKDRS